MKAYSILVLNPKGGCGKTTIATNLASYYASCGRQTALFDFDSQRSSLKWLDQRPDWCGPICKISGWNQRRYPEGMQYVVMDTPAQIQREELRNLVIRADTILIPVLPSPIDIRAAADFISVLLIFGKVRETHKQVAVIANRAHERTLVYQKLLKFLQSLDIPLVTTLREAQNYIRAAEQGIGIFEMNPSQVARDIEQWRPLIQWLEGTTAANV